MAIRSSLSPASILPDLNKPLPITPSQFTRKTGGQARKLRRSGWDEERCRSYIVRNLSWVPRNYNYEDGLRLIHAELETAFGDENGDLSFGVLEELIEIDGMLPFPDSLFQRWKHRHRHRHDDLQLPHVPHTRTIQGPVIPTAKLRYHRLNSHDPQCLLSRSDCETNSDIICTDWAVEHGWYVSARGGKTAILSLPTPSEYLERLIDPNYGRGGIFLGAKFYPWDIQVTETSQARVKGGRPLCIGCILDLFRRFGRKHSVTSHGATKSIGLLEHGREKDLGKLLKTMLLAETASSFNFDDHLRNVQWPEFGNIPNANFARKFALVPQSEPLPPDIYRQRSADENDDKILQQLWQCACEGYGSLEIDSASRSNSEAAQELFKVYLSHYFPPFHPVLFYDSGLDFEWEIKVDLAAVSSNDNSKAKPRSVDTSPRPQRNSKPSYVGLSGTSKITGIACNQDSSLKSSYWVDKSVADGSRKNHVANQIRFFSLVDKNKNIPPTNQALSPQKPHPCTVLHSQLKARALAYGGDRTSDSIFTNIAMASHASIRDNSSLHNRKRSCTDLGQKDSSNRAYDLARPPVHATAKPLQLRKPSSQQVLNSSGSSSSPIYPPRRDSIRDFRGSDASASCSREHTHQRQNSDTPSAFRSTTSTYNSDHLSETFGPSISTAKSTGSSLQDRYLADSAGIIGNFVPVGIAAIKTSHPTPTSSKGSIHSSNMSSKIPRANPYQFEPDTPEPYNQLRQTQFSDFIDNHADNAGKTAPSPRPRSVGHMKNSRSEGNDLFVARDEPLMPPKPGFTLHRSESSPSLNAAPFEAPRRRSPSPDVPAYYSEDFGHYAHAQRGRSPSPSRSTHKYEGTRSTASRYQGSQTYTTPSRTQSPIRNGTGSQDGYHLSSMSGRQSPVRREGNSNGSAHQSSVSNRHSPLRNETNSTYASASGRHSGKTSSKTLDDVVERDEYDVFRDQGTPPRFWSESPTKSPKKRSRSPMKKMFGENGWLGKSPDELSEVKRQVKKAAADSKDKPTMMGKLRHKLGEFAEKADLSPNRSGRSSNDKNPKMSILSVSLGPPEQARLLMEIELMIVHTANSFLMNQFSQGRISVDSIKRTVDSWKSRGRHIVIEFMYDQATQRDLVAANQHNFRFFGERAGNEVRINSMLYNWKQVSSLMAIRTFCDADTVILKLLFDVEQILELLGGAEALLFRLQQIRASSNEMMRVARQKKETRKSAQGQYAVPATPGRAATWLSQSSRGTPSRGPSIDHDPYHDPYGGMKLVPDSYKESK